MAIIPSNIDKHNDLEIQFDASMSEQLFNKLGANINALIDQNTFAQFTSGGTWPIPLEANYILVAACGGGGGGAGGKLAGTPLNGRIFAQAGGDGCLLHLQMIPVTGGETATIVIGAKGIGGALGGNNGTAGGNTTITIPSNGTFTWYGGKGGVWSVPWTVNQSNMEGTDIWQLEAYRKKTAPYHTRGGYKMFRESGGNLGFDNVSAEAGIWAGGSAGTNGGFGGGGSTFAGGSGGGGGTFGPGTNGTNYPGNIAAAANVSATHYGSAGGSSSDATITAFKGGDGAGGYLAILRSLIL